MRQRCRSTSKPFQGHERDFNTNIKNSQSCKRIFQTSIKVPLSSNTYICKHGGFIGGLIFLFVLKGLLLNLITVCLQFAIRSFRLQGKTEIF